MGHNRFPKKGDGPARDLGGTEMDNLEGVTRRRMQKRWGTKLQCGVTKGVTHGKRRGGGKKKGGPTNALPGCVRGGGKCESAG